MKDATEASTWSSKDPTSAPSFEGGASKPGRFPTPLGGSMQRRRHWLRRVSDGHGDGPVLDWRLRVRGVSFPVAHAFIDKYHQHVGAPHAWRFGASIWNGHARIGVSTVGNPVAPAFDGLGVVEVNRLYVRRDLNSMLRWNCCLMLLGHAAAEAERHGFNRVITYTRTDEDGASLRAAGWVCEDPAGGDSCPSAQPQWRSARGGSQPRAD